MFNILKLAEDYESTALANLKTSGLGKPMGTGQYPNIANMIANITELYKLYMDLARNTSAKV